MNLRITTFLLLATNLLISPFFSQDPASGINEDHSNNLEDWTEEQQQNFSDRIFDNKAEYININTASYEEWYALNLLSDLQINAIMDHINRMGPLIEVEELQCIPGLSMKDIRTIRNYVRSKDLIDENISLFQKLIKSEKVLLMRYGRTLEKSDAYLSDTFKPKAYRGSPNYSLLRFKLNYNNNLKAAFLLENDSGEKSLADLIKPEWDFNSFYIQMKNKNSLITNFILGDFRINMGQGLIAHNGFNVGKSLQPLYMIKYGSSFQVNNSVSEYGFYRGMATSFKLGKVELSCFASCTTEDARIYSENIDSDTVNYFRSINSSGYHRTESENDNRNTLSILAGGTSLAFNGKKLNYAINYLYHKLSTKKVGQDKLYDLFAFEGNHIHNFSIDFKYRYKNHHFVGEAALSNNYHPAIILGTVFTSGRKSNMSVFLRYYDKAYNALYPNTLSESSQARNETGLFSNIEIQLTPAIRLNTYVDLWINPWLKFQVSRPSIGKEMSVRLTYKPNKQHLFYIQLFNESKASDISNEEIKTKAVELHTRNKARLHYEYKPHPSFRLRSRLELVYIKSPKNHSNGILIYQDFLYKPIQSAYSMTVRVSINDTDDYTSRIYAYENGLINQHVFHAYYNKAYRYYINIRYAFSSNGKIEFRWARTHFQNLDSISSGNDEISGNIKTEIRSQLILRF